MLKKFLPIIYITLILIILLPPIIKAELNINAFHEKNYLISKFKNLCDKYSSIASYESIGKSYQGQDIWIFKIGNPQGGRVLWDGAMHGWEDMGSEIIYLFVEWLLESNESKANQIIENNYVLLIPIINMDSYERQNCNFENCEFGVDLNRNFENGWRYRSPNDYSYAGPFAASEPETQAVINAFKKFEPNVYVNTHYGGGPYLAYNQFNNSTVTNQILDKIDNINDERNINPTYDIRSLYGFFGLAIADANSYGANSWLYEVEGGPNCYSHTAHTITDIETIYYPQSLPIFIAMCEVAEKLAEIEQQSNIENPTPSDEDNGIDPNLPDEQNNSTTTEIPQDDDLSNEDQKDKITSEYENELNYPPDYPLNFQHENLQVVPEFNSGIIIIIFMCLTTLITIFKIKN